MPEFRPFFRFIAKPAKRRRTGIGQDEMKKDGMNRRGFLYGSSLAATARLASAAPQRRIVIAVAGRMAAAEPVKLARKALAEALAAAGYSVVHAAKGAPTILIKGDQHIAAEGFTIAQSQYRNRSVLTVGGGDARGLMYGVRELVSRLQQDPATALSFTAPLAARPLNPVRSVMRQFTCGLYDKPWFYDREMWPAYLAMLAGQRFNRLHLCFGLAYDALGHVADSYFLFTYPFLLDVPGYRVRVGGLPDSERERNLETLKYISEQAVAHGLDFQLGLWMHGYEWPAAPGVAQIEGLTAGNHAAYCRDALTLLLRRLPAVSSVSLRFHGESGIKEGSYAFWKTVFSGVPAAGRKIEIDLHAKGVDEEMIGNALATGMPVNIAPKYWAEHLGMPYHQASIRDYDMPKPGQVGKGLMTLSEGARSFTRYGFADLLRDDRRYSVRYRVFPGTQHVLAWGDPQWAGAYGRMFAFGGSNGADLMEPLTYRGRRGSAKAGVPRSGYTAAKLEARWDWQKYQDWYRSFGRGLYDPGEQAAPATALAKALACASRILPMVTTAYMPSAACDAYWPEVYWNQPLAAEASPNPYTDTLAPKLFHNAGSLDPQLFSTMHEFAGELLGQASGKCSPIQVAIWLERESGEATEQLRAAGEPRSVAEMRLAVDVAMLAGLGRFFAAKFRAGVLYALFEQSGDKRALAAALSHYRQARTAWAGIAARADGVYADVSSSDVVSEHGAWADKLTAIDADIAALETLGGKPGTDARLAAAIAAAEAKASPASVPVRHAPPSGFTAGADVALGFETDTAVREAVLWYRPVNQAQRWQSAAMTATANGWQGVIPAAATASPYPLQYYAVLRSSPETATLYPGFATLCTQPYVVLNRY
jgi:hypothetical protein